MVYSMTAYARHDMVNDAIELVWEIRSVNHKYLDITFKLPEELRDLECCLRDVVKKNVNRGKLECTLHLKRLDNATNAFTFDVELATKIINACEQLTKKMLHPAPVSPLEILNFPTIQRSPQLDWNNAQDLAKFGLQDALEILNINKRQEGKELLLVMRKRVHEMENNLQIIHNFLPQIKANQKAKLLQRLAELTISYDPARLEQELAYIIHKTDVGEEIDRIVIHLEETNKILEQGGMIGRRLDFMMQELMREVNTFAAKSLDPQMALTAVELKLLIEQIREQAHNLE
jgi:uncharacterized protein (TIGR00255 family)